MQDSPSDADACRVRPMAEQQFDHRHAALRGGTAQRPNSTRKR